MKRAGGMPQRPCRDPAQAFALVLQSWTICSYSSWRDMCKHCHAITEDATDCSCVRLQLAVLARTSSCRISHKLAVGLARALACGQAMYSILVPADKSGSDGMYLG